MLVQGAVQFKYSRVAARVIIWAPNCVMLQLQVEAKGDDFNGWGMSQFARKHPNVWVCPLTCAARIRSETACACHA